MAVVSFASALLPVILDKLISPAIKQIGFAFGVDREMEKLKRILERIQRVFVDAEERQTAETPIKAWLFALKNASYEAEDVLEEFEFEAQRKQRSLNHDNLKRKVLLYCSVHNPIMTRFSLCRRLNEIIKKIETIANEIHTFNFQLDRVPQISYCRPQTHSYVDKEKVIGREKDKEDIVSVLINHDASNNKKIVVLPIVAMGGMGKTTLSQLVYRDHRVENLFNHRIWVCVSDADFDVARLVRLIIEAATKEECKLSNMELLQGRLREIISGTRYLIVLDDVWNEDPIQWEALKTLLDCGGEGSSIVVSTRSTVAAKMMATQTIHYLEQLPEEDSWELFRRKAFPEGAEEPVGLVKIGKEIIKRCGGLPLAINTLGSMMRQKNDEIEWKAVLDSELWKMQAAKDNILPALRLSYGHLPSHLKQCFAFCAIYPKDYEMEKDTLIELWMANGYITSDGGEDLEIMGKDIFDELVWRSFFQDVFDGYDGQVKCKMHDLMHDLAQSIMGKECLNFEDTPNLEDIPSTCRHLLIPGFEELNFSIPRKQPILPTIRTIVAKRFPIKVASLLKSLRVLSLRDTYLNMSASLRQLIHLRWLDISHTSIKELPEGICSLYNLQTLKLCGCVYLEKLPDNLTDLVNLRHLDINYTEKLVCMPKGMGRLKQLHTLTRYIVSAEAERGIEQLRNLNLGGQLQLHGLDKVSNARHAEDAILSSKQNLYSIELDWGGAGSLEVFEALKPHNEIRRLVVSAYEGHQFPTWMNFPQQLQNLVHISLHSCSTCKDLPSFGQLPFLKVLNLFCMDEVKYIISKEIWNDMRTTLFPSLENLYMYDMKNLEDWWEAEESNAPALFDRQFLPCLRNLHIHSCKKLTTIPAISSLQNFTLAACSPNLTSVFSLTSDEIPGLSQLQLLRLYECHNLVHLSAFLPSLHYLSIVGCSSLESLPWPGSLTKLNYLKLRRCDGLASLPQGMEDLTSLYILDCNGLISLPEDLLKLKSLSLEDCNGLVSLPEWKEGLTQLKNLCITECDKLRSLSEGLLLRLPSLTSLKIRGNDELIRKFKFGGEYWQLIENIPDRVIGRHEHSQESSTSEGNCNFISLSPLTSKCSCLRLSS